MPSAVTFTTLLTDLQSYLERGQTVDTTVFAQLPRLINNAERRISRDLKILGFQRPLTNSFTPGEPRMLKPDRWRETISWNFGTMSLNTGQYTRRNAMFPRDYEFLRSYWPDDSVTGQPKFFADYDWYTWIVAPTPDQAYPFEVVFYEMPALLDQTNQQNWLTSYAPEALLYSALLECSPFLKNDERIPTWDTMLKQSMTALTAEEAQEMLERSVQTRQPVSTS